MSDPYQPQPQYPQPQPQYPQPQYSQPQPQYPQPQYSQPQPQYPQPPYYPPPPPPQRAPKNRTVLVVSLVVAAVVLVGFAGVVAAAYQLTRFDEAPAAGGAGDGGERRLRLKSSDIIGSWRKAGSQGTAEKLSAASVDQALDEPFAAQYDDSGTPGRTVAVWGGTGKSVGNDSGQVLFRKFMEAGAAAAGGTAGLPVQVDSGIIGGVAYCAGVSNASPPATTCYWLADEVVLGFQFGGSGGGDPAAAGKAVKDLLPGLVVYG